MKTLLQIRSSIFSDNGQSTQLADRFIEKWRAANPGGQVIVRDLAAFVEESATNRETLENQLSFAIKTAPKLTIQGGTTEVLRGIIARGLGLR